VLLWGALGDLESVFGEDSVAGVGAAANLAAIDAMAENLRIPSVSCYSVERCITYAGLAATLRLVADVTAHASSDDHFVIGMERVDIGLDVGVLGSYQFPG